MVKQHLDKSETTFRVRYGNHKKSFTKPRHKNDTELFKEYWKGIPRIKWKVLRKCHAYNQKKRQCILCLNEKYEIACYKGDNLLNKRTEILKLRLKGLTSCISLITSLKVPLH